MKRSFIHLTFLTVIFQSAFAQKAVEKSSEKIPPTPQRFAPGIISLPDRHEFGSILSFNGDEMYFGVDRGGRSEILYSRNVGGVWSEPETILSDSVYSFNDPMLSPDEQRLYFISDKPVEPKTKKDIDIWFVKKTLQGWSEPINAGTVINTGMNEYYISFTNSGAMYFASNIAADPNRLYNFDIYRSDFMDGKFQQPVKLPDAINTSRYEADVFIAPDESYIIFCSVRREGLGQGDLYISFKDREGNWTLAINMGPTINTEKHELCPFVSRDGQYFFYTSDKDIYWVSAEILKQYKN